MYVKCETDYVTGVQLFEAIVESKIVETTQKQIENLKKEASKIITETKKASEPTKQPAVVIIGNNTTAPDSSDTSTSTIPSSIPSSLPSSTSTISINSEIPPLN